MWAAIWPTTCGSCVMPGVPGYPDQPSVLAVAPEVTLAARKAWRLAVIRDLAQADAAGTKAAVLNLDGADNQHFALMAAPAAARDRIVFAAARDFGFINLNQTGQRAAARREHAAAQLGADQPRRLVGAESELALQLQSRDAIGVGGHQIGSQNQAVSGSLEWCMMVPAVTEVCRPQLAHS